VLRSYGTKVNWISEPDRGQTHAINKGFAQSRGEILAYLNSDDELLPDAVATAVDLFSSNPDVSMYYGDANYIDVEGPITGSYSTAEYSFERLMHDCCVCQPAAFWTSTIAQKVGPFDESLNYVMDYDYWLRIDRAGGLIRHVPQILASSRLYPATKTLSERRKIYAEIFAVCHRHGGYVSRNYVQGYWHHKFHEQPSWFFKVVGLIPDLEKVLVEYHALRLGNPSLPPNKAAREVLRNAMRRVPRVLQRLKRTPRLASPNSRYVQGFWHDGWLARVAHFTSAAVRSSQPIRLCGWAAVDCRLTIESGGKEVFSEILKGGAETTIEFTAGSDYATLTFDAFHVDAAGREIAFCITQTNLFSEQEL
jgi:glycosyltransferase involved in cell wall biosynthesis